MTAKEEPSRFDEQLPPHVSELVAKAFEAMDENSFTGTVYRETFPALGNWPRSPARPNYWIRWEYDTSEWKLFDRIDWGKAWHRFLLAIAVTALLYTGIVSLFEMALWSSSSDVNLLFPALFVSVMLLLPAFLLSYFFAWLRFREARKRHLARQSGPQRVTIGSPHLFDQDMWLAGVHIPLQELFIELRKVKLSSRPPLVLSLHRRNSLRSGSGAWRDTIYLLVPRGHEDEVGQLVERFRTETIGASKRKNVPAEPE